MRFFAGVDLSSLTQYRHIPSHKKNKAIGPATPMTPPTIFIQIVGFVKSTHPNKKVNASIQGTETKKRVTARLETIQSSLNLFRRAKGPTWSNPIMLASVPQIVQTPSESRLYSTITGCFL